MKENTYPVLRLPEWFDERSEYETPFRGYLSHVEVELENGDCYQVYFIDPTRLKQDIEEEAKLGRPYFAEPGMIVLPEITLEKAKEAVKHLAKDGFFEKLKPLQHSAL